MRKSSRSEGRASDSAPLTIKLTAMAHGGEALGRDDSGRVIFVPYGIPGEEVRVEVVEQKKGMARGRIVEVVSPSDSRITPRCPHFGPVVGKVSARPREGYARGCGGCQWQHVAYAAQLEFKTEIVREQFARIGKLPATPVRPAVGGQPWSYRNNMRFTPDQDGRLCLQRLESNELVPIRECHIMDSLLASTFANLQLTGADYEAVTLRAGENTSDRMIIFAAEDAEPPEIETDEPVSIHYETDGVDITLIGKQALEEQVRGRTFRVSAQSFFQVNTPMAGVLLDLVERFLAPRPDETLLDAYGGVGLFGLSLAGRVAHVIEVEEHPAAVRDARANAADLNNVEFREGRAGTVLPGLETKFQIAVVDPPRAGLEPPALDAIVARRPRAIAYVSCDPATLARDARRLVDGGYRLVEVQPVDLFPQTYHIECVAAFERADGEAPDEKSSE